VAPRALVAAGTGSSKPLLTAQATRMPPSSLPPEPIKRMAVVALCLKKVDGQAHSSESTSSACASAVTVVAVASCWASTCQPGVTATVCSACDPRTAARSWLRC
jgi:hypothetical protein